MGNTRRIKKSLKFQNFILVPGVRKIDFYDFPGKNLRKNGLEYGNHEWDDGNSGTTSETTETRDPKVRRRLCPSSWDRDHRKLFQLWTRSKKQYNGPHNSG